MHTHPKLILLNGAAGVGKSTVAHRYIDDYPLALAIEDDKLIAEMGQWLSHEDIARERVFELAKAMARTHLDGGYDVIVPHLLLDTAHADALEQIAEEHGARFIEVALVTDRDDAIRRLFARGIWGEPGSPPLTDADRPIARDLFDRMTKTLGQRPHMRQIAVIDGHADQTYRDFQAAVAAA